MDRLCGLVVRLPGYRSRGPSSIPGSTRSIGTVLSRTKATEFSFSFNINVRDRFG
jgi:hypothetical protein